LDISSWRRPDLEGTSCFACSEVIDHNYHGLVCKQTSGANTKQRHNNVADIIYHHMTKVSYRTQLEPVIGTKRNSLSGKSEKVIGDVLFEFPSAHDILDVAVVHILACTHVNAAARKQLGAARIKEQNKDSRYRGTEFTIADENTINIVPIVFETYGGMGEKAKEWFEKAYALSVQENTMINTKVLFEQMFEQIAAEIILGNAIVLARYESARNAW